jgi:hypothetical protein
MRSLHSRFTKVGFWFPIGPFTPSQEKTRISAAGSPCSSIVSIEELYQRFRNQHAVSARFSDKFFKNSEDVPPGLLEAERYKTGPPEAIAVVKELGIDPGTAQSTPMSSQGQSFDYVITVCDNSNESCPAFPGRTKLNHKAFEDPAAFQGTETECPAMLRRARNETIPDFFWVIAAQTFSLPIPIDVIGPPL